MSAVGFALLTQISADGGLTLVIAGLMVAYAGVFPVTVLGVDLVLGAAPPERAGAASAISEATQEFGLAAGIAILGSIATAVYRSQITDAIPADVRPEAAKAARDTLGGAAGAADQLPQVLLTAAGQAFTDGFRLAAGISAVALGIAALAAVIALRRVTGGADADAQADDEPDEPVAPSMRAEMPARPVPAAKRS